MLKYLDWPAIICVVCLLPYMLWISGFNDDIKFLGWVLRMNKHLYECFLKIVLAIDKYVHWRVSKIVDRIHELKENGS